MSVTPQETQAPHAPNATQAGVHVPRHYTRAGHDVFAEVVWDKRSTAIKNPDGSVVFQMDDVEL